MEDANLITTKLLTLLNVSAVKSSKKRRIYDELLSTEHSKLNKRKPNSVKIAPETIEVMHGGDQLEDGGISTDVAGEDESESTPAGAEKDDEDANATTYQHHFGAESTLLTEGVRDAVEEGRWTSSQRKLGRLGTLIEYLPEGQTSNASQKRTHLLGKLETRFKAQSEQLPNDLRVLQATLLDELSKYQDVYLTRSNIDNQMHVRDAVSLHMLNHVFRKRRRILKCNERIAHSSANKLDESLADVRDQGFTRPSVLVLLPFRSWALRWIESFISHTPSPDFQIENHSRLLSEYTLPPGAEDKLESAPSGTYPPDHVEMFKGNVDDSFRIGIKYTRKSVKLFANFYQCDLIVASPLGLRMSIDKEDNADFLSSIEVLVMDQLNALSMQNWEHLQFVLSNLNTLPKETRDADFSRIKPWYLDGHATYLRQSIMLSPYETPEFRSLFNSHLKNAAGKSRIESLYKPIQVPDGIIQNFAHFSCNSHKDEPDRRFDYFSSNVLPAILKSAVQSANTVIFIPSSFDFIRVRNSFRKLGGTSFAVLSEYSSNQDISRARQAFFSGQKSFLLISERFHFFRRYKIRGIRNLIFYGLPDHPQFYTEFLSFPFLDEGVEQADITCKAIICKYDRYRLERIAGTDGAAKLLKET